MVGSETRRCTSCKTDKSKTDFCNRKESADGLHTQCRECLARYRKNWRNNNPSSSLKIIYGISLEDYEAMVLAQRGLCAICGSQPDVHVGRLLVDHDHETDVVRGLLCHSCNVGLGFFRDNIDSMTRAIEYLKNGGIDV